MYNRIVKILMTSKNQISEFANGSATYKFANYLIVTHDKC